MHAKPGFDSQHQTKRNKLNSISQDISNNARRKVNQRLKTTSPPFLFLAYGTTTMIEGKSSVQRKSWKQQSRIMLALRNRTEAKNMAQSNMGLTLKTYVKKPSSQV